MGKEEGRGLGRGGKGVVETQRAWDRGQHDDARETQTGLTRLGFSGHVRILVFIPTAGKLWEVSKKENNACVLERSLWLWNRGKTGRPTGFSKCSFCAQYCATPYAEFCICMRDGEKLQVQEAIRDQGKAVCIQVLSGEFIYHSDLL